MNSLQNGQSALFWGGHTIVPNTWAFPKLVVYIGISLFGETTIDSKIAIHFLSMALYTAKLILLGSACRRSLVSYCTTRFVVWGLGAKFGGFVAFGV